MKDTIKKILASFDIELRKITNEENNASQLFKKHQLLYQKYRNYTMIPEKEFLDNLELCYSYRNIPGAIVECGVWRGGMIAAIAETVGKDRTYYLFDSFEGLPEVKEIDGKAAQKWQANKESPGYYDNCKAEEEYAEKAMTLAQVNKKHLVKGWFSNTLSTYPADEKIAILRLDGDWYESTMDCLTNLFDKVVPGGVILIDDYYMWDGCSRAVHDFLSMRKATERIQKSINGVCYIQKNYD
ncbi:TylF/MycF/NovP-related O-methyltransferase [Cytophagaceae bacterium YF14B1]|uniref:TylF/MycF/NovP-related O-methyltransferase n=1 Tax=Xanthocytophaga flava TaxID=3048013 RepID=A0AAE3QTJ1_9BACT|nr:TylF/MycF/NovP-related O-methyltransferase [Xanthocytophaga flavus]MDJ1482393.1 TylF/MycF/NovP-related O-methyltransferase [Xanthocytophaga flavus]